MTVSPGIAGPAVDRGVAALVNALRGDGDDGRRTAPGAAHVAPRTAAAACPAATRTRTVPRWMLAPAPDRTDVPHRVPVPRHATDASASLPALRAGAEDRAARSGAQGPGGRGWQRVQGRRRRQCQFMSSRVHGDALM